MLKKVMASGLAALWLLSAPAEATLLQFTISGVDVNSAGQVEYASFQVDSDPTPDGSAAGIGFFVAAVPGVFQYGSTATFEPQDITFYLDRAHGYDDPTTNAGGLFVGEGDLLGFYGPQLFTGPIDRPTVQTGDFTIFDEFSGSPISLSIRAVPEPATWMMMMVGFAAVGSSIRRRDRNQLIRSS